MTHADPMVQPADTPPPLSVTMDLHLIAHELLLINFLSR